MNPATAYVGDYSYSLDNLENNAKKRYLVAVQSGKPVLDEELSEIGYRNLDFLRRYLERNVGDGVLDGDRTSVLESDTVPGRTWRVEESTVSNENNFVVKGGTAEKPAILIVKGFPLLLFSDVEYNQQNNSGSLEDDNFTNTTIPALNPPGVGSRTDTVYVDFYLAEVSSEVGSEYQDTTIKDTNLNLQSANRWRLVQDILVAQGTTTIPVDSLDANNIYHRYYKLAEINRTAGDNTITTANIVDKRTYINTLENLSNGKGELNVYNAFVQNDLTVHGTMTIINQTQTNQEQLVITCNDPGVDALVINKTESGEALVINKDDPGYAVQITATGSDDAIHVNKTGSGYAINVNSGSILLDNDTDLFYSPSIEGVNSLRTHIDNQLVLMEPTGFPNKTETTFSFNDATRTFTISPTGVSFSVYINNTKYTKNSAEDVVISDVEGLWFIYYNYNGVLTASQTPWSISQTAPVAYIYWDATNKQTIVLAEERHGTVMDSKTHEYLHRTIGTRYYSGLALSGSTSGNGNADADAQIAMTNGIIYDEDNVISIFDGTGSNFFEQELSPIAYIPIFYQIGTGHWRKKTATQYPVYENVGSGRIGWNQFSGTWSVVEVGNNNYVPMFIFATNDIFDPIIAVLGQSEHNTFLDAQNDSNYQSLVFGSLPFQEMKILFRLIFQTANGHSNAVKANLVDIQDLRSISNVPSGSYVATDHGALSGLTDQDHPASAIFTNFVNFNGSLTAIDNDVQKALDTLDDIWVRISPSNSNTDDLYRVGDVIIGTNTESVDAKLRVADNFGNKHRTRIQALGAPTSINQLAGQLLLSADNRDTVISAVVETNIGTETWAAAPRVGIQVRTNNLGTIIDALRITHDGRFGFGSTTVTTGFRAQVEGGLHITGAERVDGIVTFNNAVNFSTQTADRVAIFDNSKNLVSTTVTLSELQVLDDFVENVQDIVGGMVSGNTENGIAVTYDDAAGKLNFDVNDPVLTIAGGASGSATMTNLGNTTITVALNVEDVEDIVGAMVSGNTENGIAVTYDDAAGKLNFDVNDPVITIAGGASGSATMTNLGNTTINVTLNKEDVQDYVGEMITNGTKAGISVVYDDPNNRINFDVNDFTITLTGNVSGSGTVTDLGNVSISVTVLNDSHTHDTRYYTKTETDNRYVNRTGDTMSGALTLASGTANGLKFPDNAFGGTGDTAGMRLYASSGEDQVLELYVTNEANDRINFSTPSNTGVRINNNTVWHAGNHGAGSGLNADLVDGLDVHTGRNNQANRIVRTDGDGYLQTGWINTDSGNAGTATISRVYASNDNYIRFYTPGNFLTKLLENGGANYDIKDSWFRYYGDGSHVRLYGNSRQMVFRTDGTTQYSSGVGNYPFVWMYNGDSSGNRVMLLETNGQIWTSNYGWLHSYFAASGHTHDNSTLTSIDWSKVTNKPSPTITLTGGVTGSGIMSSLGSVTISTTVSGVNQLGNHVFATSSGMRIQLDGYQISGGKLNFGDSDYVYLQEGPDDILTIFADKGMNIIGGGTSPIAINRLNGAFANLSGTFSGTWSSGSVTTSSATITGGTISGVSLSTQGNVNFNTSGQQTIFFNDTHWNCSFSQTILKFQNTTIHPTSWHQIVFNSCQFRLTFETYSSSVGTTRMTIDTSGVSIPNLTGVTSVNAIVYKTGNLYATYTTTVGGYTYRQIIVDAGLFTANKHCVFLINSGDYSDTRFNFVGIIGGDVGQIIYVINTKSQTNELNINGGALYFQSHGRYNLYSAINTFHEYALYAGGAIGLIKVTTTTTNGYFPREVSFSEYRGLWLPISITSHASFEGGLGAQGIAGYGLTHTRYAKTSPPVA